jgi:C4-dicarboxylate-specific signal transduction histidine kinase
MRRLSFLGLLVLSLLVGAPALRAQDSTPPRKTVLVLMPVQPGRPAYDRVLASLLDGIHRNAAAPSAVFVENLGEPNPEDLAAIEAQWTWLKTKYQTRTIDAVAIVGDPRTVMVRERLSLPPRTPLVFIGGTGTLLLPRPASATGVVGGEFVSPFVQLLRRVLPGTRRIVFVGGASPADHAANDLVLARLRQVAGDLEIEEMTGLSIAEMQARARRVPAQSVFYVGITLLDRNHRALSHPMIVSALKSVTPGPIFAPLDTALGQGLLGGVMLSPERVGEELGRMVSRVLAGEDPDRIPLQHVAPRVELDWREMQRLGIPESRVPAGVTIVNREPSLFARNPGLVLVTMGVVLIQAALIAWLAIEQRRRRRTEAQLAEGLRFEAMIHEVSERLANIPPVRLDEQMPDVLRTLGKALDVDRCSLRRYVPERRTFTVAARWCRSGSTVGIDEETMVDGTVDGTLEQIERVAQGETVAVRDVVDLPLPPSMAEVARRHDVRGLLGVPIRIDGRTVAVLVLGTRAPRTWSPHEITALRPVAEIVGAALVRQQQEREAREHRDTLSHLDRVAVLGELASSLAHELNQPLGAILANAEAARLMLAAQPPRLQDLRAALDDIVSDDERAGQIIRNMRAMIRRRPPTTEPVDVREAVTGAVRLVQQDALLRRCHIEVAHATSPLTVLCDRVQLQQVVLNLLGNAIDASCDGSAAGQVITVETRPAGSEAVTLSVRDRGPGLGAEVIGRMFDPFYSTKASGLGVGLTICRSIVEAYGGSITAENAEGGGARFTVRLPAGATAADAESIGA